MKYTLLYLATVLFVFWIVCVFALGFSGPIHVILGMAVLIAINHFILNRKDNDTNS